MFKKISAVAMLLAVAGVSTSVAAATVSDTFKVRITIQAACTVTAGAASDIDVGTHLASATNLSGTRTISVTCSKTTPYNIGLTPSNSSTTGAGIMTRTTTPTDTVAYQLRSVSPTGPAWGNTATSAAVGNGVAGTGTGVAQPISVFAAVPSANSAPGNYEDTVTVTVHY